MTAPLSDTIVQDWQAGLRSLIHEAQAMATELLALRQERARVVALSRASDTEWTGGWAEPAWHCEHERIAAYQRGALLENAAALGDYEGRQSDAIESLKRGHQALAKQFVDMKSYADHVEIKRRALEDALTARRCHAPMLHQGHASYAHGPSAGHFTYTCPDCEPALAVTLQVPAPPASLPEPVYCLRCGACGVTDCCPHTRCHEYRATPTDQIAALTEVQRVIRRSGPLWWKDPTNAAMAQQVDEALAASVPIQPAPPKETPA